MIGLSSIGAEIAARRKLRKFTQAELAKLALVSRSTLDALENGRIGELGFSKVTKILAALGVELKLEERCSKRPTLEELIEQNRREDERLGRRR